MKKNGSCSFPVLAGLITATLTSVASAQAPQAPAPRAASAPDGAGAEVAPPSSSSSFVYFLGGQLGLPFGESVDDGSEFYPSLGVLAEAGVTLGHQLDITGYFQFGFGGLNQNEYKRRAEAKGNEVGTSQPAFTLGVGPQVRWTLFRAGTIAPYVGVGGGFSMLSVRIDEKENPNCEPVGGPDECEPATLDNANYFGLTGGPVVGLRFAELSGIDRKAREKNGGGTSVFVQFAMRYGLLWGGSDTLDGTAASDLDLHHFEFAAGISGF